jgi:hypothetical protein
LAVATGLPNRGVKQQAFGVIQEPNTAAVLTEISFITDPAEENRRRDPNYVARLGGAIASGVMDSLRTRGLTPRAKGGRKGAQIELEDGYSLGIAAASTVTKQKTRRRK